jgi:hypothetical protein
MAAKKKPKKTAKKLGGMTMAQAVKKDPALGKMSLNEVLGKVKAKKVAKKVVAKKTAKKSAKKTAKKSRKWTPAFKHHMQAARHAKDTGVKNLGQLTAIIAETAAEIRSETNVSPVVAKRLASSEVHKLLREGVLAIKGDKLYLRNPSGPDVLLNAPKLMPIPILKHRINLLVEEIEARRLAGEDVSAPAYQPKGHLTGGRYKLRPARKHLST